MKAPQDGFELTTRFYLKPKVLPLAQHAPVNNSIMQLCMYQNRDLVWFLMLNMGIF